MYEISWLPLKTKHSFFHVVNIQWSWRELKNSTVMLLLNQIPHKNTEEWCFSLIYCYTVISFPANYQTSQSLISGQLHHRSFRSDQKLFPVQVYKPEKKLFLLFVLYQTEVVLFNQSYASFSTVIHYLYLVGLLLHLKISQICWPVWQLLYQEWRCSLLPILVKYIKQFCSMLCHEGVQRALMVEPSTFRSLEGLWFQQML